jgi:hypothetical protein
LPNSTASGLLLLPVFCSELDISRSRDIIQQHWPNGIAEGLTKKRISYIIKLGEIGFEKEIG